MKFKELDLKKIREEVGLDFAHFTYKKGMCSCCYGPRDLPSIYWHNREVKKDNYTYILFKNADNGSGVVTREDEICRPSMYGYRKEYISWDFPMEWMKKVVDMLQEQLGDEYRVIKPESNMRCIEIEKVQRLIGIRY